MGTLLLVVVTTAAVPALPTRGPAAAFEPHAYRGQPPVAYVSHGRVLVLDGTGGPPRPVAQGRATCCVAWAPDGAHLGFQDGSNLWMSDTRGEHTRRVASDVRRWAWSPDGEAIAVLPRTRDRRRAFGIDFYAIDLPRFRLTLLPHDEVLDFAWAGLGRRVAVSARRATRGSPDAVPTTLSMLEVPGPYGDCATLCPEPAQPVSIDNPSAGSADIYFAGWAPDVTSLAIWTGSTESGPPDGGRELALVAPSGGPITPLARTVVKRSWVQWHRDGDRLLVVEDRTGAGPAVSLCLVASGCRIVDRAAPSATDPAWSDADRMAYVTSAPTPGAPPGDDSVLWVADRDGGAATVAARGGAATPRWLPDGRHLLFTRHATLWLLDVTTGAAVAIAGPIDGPSTASSTVPPSDGSGRGADRLFAVAP